MQIHFITLWVRINDTALWLQFPWGVLSRWMGKHFACLRTILVHLQKCCFQDSILEIQMSTFTSLSLASSYWHMIIQHLHALQVPTSLEVHDAGDECSSWGSKEHTTTVLTYVVFNTSIYSLLYIPGLCLFQKTVVSMNKRPVLVVIRAEQPHKLSKFQGHQRQRWHKQCFC